MISYNTFWYNHRSKPRRERTLPKTYLPSSRSPSLPPRASRNSPLFYKRNHKTCMLLFGRSVKSTLCTVPMEGQFSVKVHCEEPHTPAWTIHVKHRRYNVWHSVHLFQPVCDWIWVTHYNELVILVTEYQISGQEWSLNEFRHFVTMTMCIRSLNGFCIFLPKTKVRWNFCNSES